MDDEKNNVNKLTTQVKREKDPRRVELGRQLGLNTQANRRKKKQANELKNGENSLTFNNTTLFLIGVGSVIILFFIACFVKGKEKIFNYISGRNKTDVKATPTSINDEKKSEAIILKDQEVEKKQNVDDDI